MINGYYLSAYISIADLANVKYPNIILRHDQNISLWYKENSDIKLVYYWELERISGLKHHDISFFSIDQAMNLISDLLKKVNLTLDDIIDIWGCPQLKEKREVYEQEELHLPVHSIAHLFSATFYDTDLTKKNKILCFAADGGPDNVIDSAVRYMNHYVGCYIVSGEIIEYFPILSPAILWTEAVSLFHMPEGTLMALASASVSELKIHNNQFIPIRNMFYFNDVREYLRDLYKYCKNITEKDMGILFNCFDKNFSKEENVISMVIKEINLLSIQIMEKNINSCIKRFNLDPSEVYLSLSGGFALNCPTNSYLLDKYGFKGFMAPPCVNDTGISMGIALMNFYNDNHNFNFKLGNAYHGYNDHDLDYALGEFNQFIKHVDYNVNYNTVVNDIINYPIVWFDGKAEIGPRALGHRSILGDPRNKETKDILNTIKQREWWRPVAPIVLWDKMENWFKKCKESPFMLQIFTIKEDKLENIPSIAHLDYSSRVQTISASDDCDLYEVLKAFDKKTGVPIICNTSLNDKGEPIINTIGEALNFAIRKRIPVVYINKCRIQLKEFDKYEEVKPLKRRLDVVVYKNNEEKEDLIKKLNPFDLDNEKIYCYYDLFYKDKKLSLINKEHVNIFNKTADKVIKSYRK